MTVGGMRVLGMTRLRVLNSLPQRHQDYFFGEVRTLCARYIALASRHYPKIDRASDTRELVSEVMAKLLGVSGSGAEQGAGEADAGEGDGQNEPERENRPAQQGSEEPVPHQLHEKEGKTDRARGEQEKPDRRRSFRRQLSDVVQRMRSTMRSGG